MSYKIDKDAKIYIAGHRGLVGSAIHRRLEAGGFSNLITRTHDELDLMNQALVGKFFQVKKPEYVFLAAARVGGIHANSTYPAEFINNNLMIQSNVIHSAYINNVKKLLFLGSSCIYPRLSPQPIREEYLLTGELEPTNEAYAIAKIAGIKLCQAYGKQYGFNAISIMPTNLYGPGDNFNIEDSHVLPALIRKFHLAKLASKGDIKAVQKDELTYGPIPDKIKSSLGLANSLNKFSNPDPAVTIWGTGKPRREFLFVDDLADAALFLMENYDNSDIVNVGSGKEISILELAELIRDVVGYKGKISLDTSKPDGTPQKLLDSGRLSSLGWKSKTGLREGIKLTYNWYLANQRR